MAAAASPRIERSPSSSSAGPLGEGVAAALSGRVKVEHESGIVRVGSGRYDREGIPQLFGSGPA